MVRNTYSEDAREDRPACAWTHATLLHTSTANIDHVAMVASEIELVWVESHVSATGRVYDEDDCIHCSSLFGACDHIVFCEVSNVSGKDSAWARDRLIST